MIFKRAAKTLVQETKEEVKKESIPVFRLLGAAIGLYLIFSEAQKLNQPSTTNVTILNICGKETQDGTQCWNCKGCN